MLPLYRTGFFLVFLGNIMYNGKQKFGGNHERRSKVSIQSRL